jgi:flagellar hook-length control protein FliK
LTGLDMVAVAPKAEGATNTPPLRNPVAKGKNENDFPRQLKKASSKQSVRQESKGAGSLREATTAKLRFLKNHGEQERAGPGAEVISKSCHISEKQETNLPPNAAEKERELAGMPYPLLLAGADVNPKPIGEELNLKAGAESSPEMENMTLPREDGKSLLDDNAVKNATGQFSNLGDGKLFLIENSALFPTTSSQEEATIASVVKLAAALSGDLTPGTEVIKHSLDGKTLSLLEEAAKKKPEPAFNAARELDIKVASEGESGILVAGEELLASGEKSYAQVPAMIVKNETGTSLQEQESLVLAGKLRANESQPGSEPRLNPATPEKEVARTSQPGSIQSQPEKAGQEIAEQFPLNERMQQGEQGQETKKTGAKVEVQLNSGKENNMPLLSKAAGEPVKAGYDPAALAVLLAKAQGKGEKLSGKDQAEHTKEDGKGTSGEKPDHKGSLVKGEVVSFRLPEAAAKPQSESNAAEELKLAENDKNQPLKANMPEKELVELPENRESGKNLPGFKMEHMLQDNNFRNAGKPIQEKSWVDPEKFMEQVVRKAEVMIKQNSSQIRIQLHPEFLGKMTIKLVLEDGLLTARFITENHQVKHLLESNLNSLRQSLESQGIRVEKTEVNVQLNNGGLFDGSEGSRQDLWEQPRFSLQYNSSEAGSDAYQASSIGDELLEDGSTESSETNGISADGSMNFLI